MFVELDLQSEVPLYAQLMDQLIVGMATGELKPGEPLPSVRALAADLGINMHTVNKAYQLLKQEGFLQVHRKQGVIVQPDGMPGVSAPFLDRMQAGIRTLAAESILRGMDESAFVQACTDIYRSYADRIQGGTDSP